MSQAFSLSPLIKLTEQQSSAATRKLGELNQQQQQANQQLSMLQQYRQDYQDQLTQAIRQGIGPAQLNNFEQFIAKLDTAIGQQLQTVEQCRLASEQGRQHYAELQRKLQSFYALQQRHLDAEHHRAAKIEQKQMDEHASRTSSFKQFQY